MAGKRRAATWAELEALPAATRESVQAGLTSWANDRFAIDLAYHWPMTERQLRVARSPHGFARRQPSGWPECWAEHGSLRDYLLTVYIWDQELATSKRATAGAERAAYHEHVLNLVVPQVQAIAAMCELGHVDPAAQPRTSDRWQPAPPPLPHQPEAVTPQPGGGRESAQNAAPPPAQSGQARPHAGSPVQPGPWDGLISRQGPTRSTTPERDPVDR